MTREIPGHVSRWQDGKRSIVPWQEATAQGRTGTPENRILSSPKTFPEPDWGVTPLQRRTGPQRLESLSRRIWNQIQADPTMTPQILKYYHEELWKSGMPVTYEDIKNIAIGLLEKAELERRAKLKSYSVE